MLLKALKTCWVRNKKIENQVYLFFIEISFFKGGTGTIKNVAIKERIINIWIIQCVWRKKSDLIEVNRGEINIKISRIRSSWSAYFL